MRRRKKTWRCCFFKDIPFFISQVFQRFSPPSYSNLILYRRMKSITIERRFEPTMGLQQWHIFLFFSYYHIKVEEFLFQPLNLNYCFHPILSAGIEIETRRWLNLSKVHIFFLSLPSAADTVPHQTTTNWWMPEKNQKEFCFSLVFFIFFFTLAHNFIRQRPQ